MIDGMKIRMGGVEYEVPPLNFNSLKKLTGKLRDFKVDGIPTPEQMDVIIEVVFLAMRRNYPEMTQETLGDLIDMGNAFTIFQAVMGQSGMVGTGEVMRPASP
jgi:hypothetical protein